MEWLSELLFDFRRCRKSEQDVITAVARNTSSHRVTQLEAVLRELVEESEIVCWSADDDGRSLPHLKRATGKASAVLSGED